MLFAMLHASGHWSILVAGVSSIRVNFAKSQMRSDGHDGLVGHSWCCTPSQRAWQPEPRHLPGPLFNVPIESGVEQCRVEDVVLHRNIGLWMSLIQWNVSNI